MVKKHLITGVIMFFCLCTTQERNNPFDFHGSNPPEWKLATADAGFGKRCSHTSLVFNEKMWVIGGYSNGDSLKVYEDVWCSSNGSEWTRVTDSAGFIARYDHSSVVFNGKMWILGGRDQSNTYTSVWYSSDGSTWTCATPAIKQMTGTGTATVRPIYFTPRESHTSVVFNNKMWVIGGRNSDGETAVEYSDVWSSPDGTNWTKVTAAAGFGGRFSHTSVEFDSKLWVVGGYSNGKSLNDSWCSTGGTTWGQVTSNNGFPTLYGSSLLGYNNKMWIIGGNSSRAPVWYTNDGVTGEKVSEDAIFGARWDHTSILFNEKIWVIGGRRGSTYLDDVWYLD